MANAIQKLGAYTRLLRLSNAPTAVADVWMGYAVLAGALKPTTELICMTCASLLLYHAGMIGNDIADVFDDRAEGRNRPLATKEILGWDAMRLQRWMEAGGILLASLAAWRVTLLLPLLVALVLWMLVPWYNSPLKKTGWGPLLMGSCRGLNVSLGMSIAGFGTLSFAAPIGVAGYIAGVTVFASNERTGDHRKHLGWGMMLSLISIAWLFAISAHGPSYSRMPASVLLIWAVTAAFALRGMAAAIAQPTPKVIGRGVGIAIQGIIVIDATLAALYAGPMAGLAIFALLPVTMLLSRWIPQT